MPQNAAQANGGLTVEKGSRMETLDGVGEVTVEKTGESLGRFPYSLVTDRRDGSVLHSADLVIELGKAGWKAQQTGGPLRLTIADGRSILFLVKKITLGTWEVELETSGPLA